MEAMRVVSGEILSFVPGQRRADEEVRPDRIPSFPFLLAEIFYGEIFPAGIMIAGMSYSL